MPSEGLQMNDAKGKRGWQEGRGVREKEGERGEEEVGAVFGERGISEESPDPEINGQSNPFTITRRKTDGSRCKPAAGRAASESRPPLGASGVWWGRARPYAGRRETPQSGRSEERSQREVERLQRVEVGGMLRCALSPDRRLPAPHGRLREEGEFQA